MVLADRNTVRMLAEHWACCTETVYRRIKDGTLPCLKMKGMVRITREQVEEYERECSNSGVTPTEPSTPSTVPGLSDAFQRGQEIAGKLKRSSPNSKPEPPPLQ